MKKEVIELLRSTKMEKKEYIKNELIELIDTTNKDAIGYIDGLLSMPFVESALDLAISIVYNNEDAFKEILEEGDYIDDGHKAFTIVVAIIETMKDIKYNPF